MSAKDNSMSKFKLVLIGVFGLAIVLGVGSFATSKRNNSVQWSNIVVWGTIQQEAFDIALKNSSIGKNENVTVTYVKKDKSDFDSSFVEALADGRGPDVVVLREDQLYKNRNKIIAIPYKSYTERTFKDTFIQEGNLFLSPDGILALPFIVDPMVMYWNRDIFSNNLIALPPKYWDEIYPMVDKITHRDSSANITQSTISFGEWRNVTNAKEILSMLMLQAGTPISIRNSQGITSALNYSNGCPVSPGVSAVNFYTQFSNPTSASYSWNRSLPSSLNFFLSGDLALYIGFASEIFPIQQKNSNLNFDVVMVPQVREVEGQDKNCKIVKSVFAHMYGLAIVKQSRQANAAFEMIRSLVEPASLKALESVTNLPPVRLDLLSDKPTDAFRSVFYNSALISKSWTDPEPDESATIFRDMIESVTSGRGRVNEVLISAQTELSALYK